MSAKEHRNRAVRSIALAAAVVLLAAFAYTKIAPADRVAVKAPTEVVRQDNSDGAPKPGSPDGDSAAPGASSPTTTSSVDSATANSDELFFPPQPAPGSQREFDPSNAPVVPQGIAAEEYIKDYYAALNEGDWAKTSTMLPDVYPSESVEQFKGLQYGYEPLSYNVLSVTPSNEGVAAFVVHTTEDNGVWNTIWTFLNTDRGLVVKDLVWSRPNGSGCH